MPDLFRSPRIIICDDKDPHQVFIETYEGRVRFAPLKMEFIGCPDLRKKFDALKIERIPIAFLEINPKTMTLDLVITGDRPGHYSCLALRALTWGMITHEFVDAVFSANQRLRVWTNYVPVIR